MEVKNKKIIITGAGNGMGRELTLQLLQKGASIIAIDIDEKGLEETKKLANSEKLTTHIVDISSDESINKFKKDCEKYSNIDGLINNAGIIQPFVSVEKIDINTINRVMNINFFGPLKLTKLFIENLKKNKESYIVNISSMGGFFPFPGQSIYGASKAALKLFTEALYAELLNTNIHVMVVFPGAIATNIAKNSNVDFKTDTKNSDYKMLSPIKAASMIIEGIEKNKFQLYVGSDSKFMHFMYKLNPKKAINFINKKMGN